MKLNRRTAMAAGLSSMLSLLPVAGQAQTAEPGALKLQNGAALPAIGMGTWLTFNIDPDGPEMASRKEVLDIFFARGGGMIDSSPMYGMSEAVIGKLLTESGRPDSLFSATKVWVNFANMGRPQLEASRDLWGETGDNPLDLVHVHNLLNWEAHLPMLREAKARGEVRYVGLTTSHGRRHGDLERLMKREPLDAVQFTYNILDREAENRLLPAAMEAGLPVIINRPFQGGALFDRFQKHPLPDWADEIDAENWAQFFLKFIISHPGVTCAIPATSRPAHMAENMGALDGRLPDAELRRRMIAYVENL